jgi:hypothetical protein
MPDTNFSSPRWQTPSPAAWELARRREATLRPLAESPTVSPFDVQNAAHELCLGRTQIYELIARYRKRPHTSTRLRGKRARRTRSRFLKPAIEEIVYDVVKKFFLTRSVLEFLISCSSSRWHVTNKACQRHLLAASV